MVKERDIIVIVWDDTNEKGEMRDKCDRNGRYAWARVMRMRMHQNGIMEVVRDGMKSKRDRKDGTG